MPGTITLIKQGAFDNDVMSTINTNFSNQDSIVATSSNSALAFGSFGTAITLLPSTAPAGTYTVSVYAVITTTITVATSWLFTLGWTDDAQAQTATVSTSSTMTANANQQGQYVFRSKGGAAITITPTAASAGAGVIAYSVVLQRAI